MEQDVKLNKIDDESKEKVIKYLTIDGYNESFIAHFLLQADGQDNPLKFITMKFPEALD